MLIVTGYVFQHAYGSHIFPLERWDFFLGMAWKLQNCYAKAGPGPVHRACATPFEKKMMSIHLICYANYPYVVSILHYSMSIHLVHYVNLSLCGVWQSLGISVWARKRFYVRGQWRTLRGRRRRSPPLREREREREIGGCRTRKYYFVSVNEVCLFTRLLSLPISTLLLFYIWEELLF